MTTNAATDTTQTTQTTQDQGTQQTTQDQQTNADAKPNTDGGKQTGDAGDKGTGAPEKYEAFTLPEGFEYSAEDLTKFTTYAKENGYSQAQAQKAMDREFAVATDVVTELASQHKANLTQWEAEAKADKEIGGANYEANLGIAKKGMEGAGGADMVKLFEDYGLNAHPLVIRYFLKVGKTLSNDTVETGKQEAGTDTRTAAQILFPNMK